MGILEDSIMRLLNRTEDRAERAMDKLLQRLATMEKGQDKVARIIHKMSKQAELKTPEQIREYIKGLHTHESFEITVLMNWLADVTGVSDALAPIIAYTLEIIFYLLCASMGIIVIVLRRQILTVLYTVSFVLRTVLGKIESITNKLLFPEQSRQKPPTPSQPSVSPLVESQP